MVIKYNKLTTHNNKSEVLAGEMMINSSLTSPWPGFLLWNLLTPTWSAKKYLISLSCKIGPPVFPVFWRHSFCCLQQKTQLSTSPEKHINPSVTWFLLWYVHFPQTSNFLHFPDSGSKNTHFLFFFFSKYEWPCFS